MNVRVLKVLAIILGAIILILLAVFILLLVGVRRHALDGPGMVYDFREQDLKGRWSEVGGDAVLNFSVSGVKYTNVWGENGAADYTAEDTGFPAADAEVKLDFPGGGMPFEYMLFHWEDIDGQTVGVLSGVVIEYDGRGAVVFMEFLRDADGVTVPADWQSPLAHRYNDRDPVPTMMTAE